MLRGENPFYKRVLPPWAVDKTNAFRHFAKSFGRAFSKAREVEGAKPSSTSAEVEINLGVSFLKAFFFAPICSKKKAAKAFVQFDNLYTFCLHSRGEKPFF